jgi:hypothetical protein
MGVFDGSVKTQRRVKDPITDKLVVQLSSLTLAAINTPAALIVSGSDVSVVNGDQQLQVHQNRYMKVGMNHDIKIGMNETELVDMNQTITVMQDYTRNIMANSLINTTGNYTKNVLSNYTKSITGFSVNTITGFYTKFVALDYTKTIVGTSLSVITGNYTKRVKSNYVKNVTGTSSNTVTGDYTKVLSSNYVKEVTGTSSVKVVSTSIVQYQGNHNRTCGSDHTMMIAGSNTHTTCGPTIRTEIDVQVSQQVDDQTHGQPTNLNQSHSNWFTATDKKGTYQSALKIDYTSGLVLSGSIMKLDTNVLNYGCNATHNTFFVEKFDCGVSKQEVGCAKEKIRGVSVRVGGLIGDASVNTSKATVAGVKVACATLGTFATQLQAVPAKVVAGIVAAFNSFIM